ncbi:MAG: sugar ABC transporter permease [Chloroflexi bacterium]|nr:sugar ABC transporter permease [Chloroflexota bacterium]MBI5054586.1 sugar ABC transporter permease [Chloroflexota bacterium]MBI5081658.1 sugar ABC transporter permease [Chloroflexota bacterium]
MRRFFQKHGWSYLFILPSMTTFIVFVFIPVVWAFIISFQKYSLRSGGRWMDPFYANYETAFTQFGGIFITAIQNTVVYSFFTVTANIFLGLILSSLIQPLSHSLRTFFRAAYYLPAVTSALIIGMTWSFIYNAQWGFANYLLRLLGLPLVRWISDPDIALASVTASAILTIPATAVVLYSAAMGSIPTEYYEAAELDGANGIQKWWHITVPLIKSTTLYLVVLYSIASFEVFERIYIMVPSGVGNSTQTIVTQIYNNGFKDLNFGVGAAQAFVLFVMIAIIAAFQFRFLQSDVEY